MEETNPMSEGPAESNVQMTQPDPEKAQPKPKSKKGWLYGLIAAAVIILGAGAWYLASMPAEEGPPQLDLGGGKFQGRLVTDTRGFGTFDQADIDAYTKVSGLETVAAGVNPFYVTEEMSVAEILDIKKGLAPKSGLRYLFALWREGGSWELFPTAGPYRGDINVISNADTFKVQPYEVFFLITSASGEYDRTVIHGASEVPKDFNLPADPNMSGWMALGLGKDDIKMFSNKIVAIWELGTDGVFKKRDDFCKFEPDTSITWFKLKAGAADPTHFDRVCAEEVVKEAAPEEKVEEKVVEEVAKRICVAENDSFSNMWVWYDRDRELALEDRKLGDVKDEIIAYCLELPEKAITIDCADIDFEAAENDRYLQRIIGTIDMNCLSAETLEGAKVASEDALVISYNNLKTTAAEDKVAVNVCEFKSTAFCDVCNTWPLIDQLMSTQQDVDYTVYAKELEALCLLVPGVNINCGLIDTENPDNSETQYDIFRLAYQDCTRGYADHVEAQVAFEPTGRTLYNQLSTAGGCDAVTAADDQYTYCQVADQYESEKLAATLENRGYGYGDIKCEDYLGYFTDICLDYQLAALTPEIDACVDDEGNSVLTCDETTQQIFKALIEYINVNIVKDYENIRLATLQHLADMLEEQRAAEEGVKVSEITDESGDTTIGGLETTGPDLSDKDYLAILADMVRLNEQYGGVTLQNMKDSVKKTTGLDVTASEVVAILEDIEFMPSLTVEQIPIVQATKNAILAEIGMIETGVNDMN